MTDLIFLDDNTFFSDNLFILRTVKLVLSNVEECSYFVKVSVGKKFNYEQVVLQLVGQWSAPSHDNVYWQDNEHPHSC